MVLFAQCFSGYFCSPADFQICLLQNSLRRECTGHLFPPPQWAAVKSSSSRRLRTIHRGEGLTYGKPRCCLGGSPWYVWHKPPHTALHRNSGHPAVSEQIGICCTQADDWLEVFSEQVVSGTELHSVVRESDGLLSAKRHQSPAV